MLIPMTFIRDIRNMTDHKVIVEIEASCLGDDIDVRAVLNVNAIDQRESFHESIVSEVAAGGGGQGPGGQSI